MTRNIFFRDFTLLKATALGTLIALAAVMGDVPHGQTKAETQVEDGMRIIPVVFDLIAPCPKDKTGVDL